MRIPSHFPGLCATSTTTLFTQRRIRPTSKALAARESLRGLLLVVDCRRGLLPGDEELLAWAAAAGRPVHVLLSKADKLGRQPLHPAHVAFAVGGVGCPA